MARHSAKHSKPASVRNPLRGVNWLAVFGAVGACMLLLALGAFAVRGGFRTRPGESQPAVAQPASSRSSTTTADSTTTPVEVPTLVGLKLDEAKLVLARPSPPSPPKTPHPARSRARASS
jgi:hypothetical protein